ncbi:MAG: hypothetical protein SFY67_06325 [Candidatus Melainabacteria bacterium]|nr:hypothetical protein [Candidatus Melainabacteria bacterium]
MTQIAPLFSERDRILIEKLKYDPALEPKYNALSGVLIWQDELPSNVTPNGHDVLGTLWTGRSMLHRGFTLSDAPINPEYCIEVWEQALTEIPNWPGFKRLTLNETDKTFLNKNLAQEGGFD